MIKINYQDYLENFQHQIKEIVIKNLARAFDDIGDYLKPTSKFSNNLLQLEGRYNQIRSEHNRGLITYDVYLSQINKITAALVDLIDLFNYPDLKVQDDEVFIQHLAAYQKAQQSTPAKIEAPSAEANPKTPASAVSQVPMSSSLSPMETVLDFDLYGEENKNLLIFYPRIYRNLRAFVIRNVPDKKAMNEMVQAIESRRPALESFKEKMDQIEDHYHQIMKHDKSKIFVAKLKKLRLVHNEVNFENLDNVANQEAFISHFYEELLKLSLITKAL